MFKKIIKKIVLWYLGEIALEHCANASTCDLCPFGTEECRCTIVQVENAIRYNVNMWR